MRLLRQFKERHDVFFISYDEENADVNWRSLLKAAPHAKRVHGVKGIQEAHKKASQESKSDYFFTVDADNIIDSRFSFSEIPNFKNNRDAVHVWRCQNPVNLLVYGYGGVKLWPKDLFIRAENSGVDITTSLAKGRYYIQPSIASTTMFHSSPYSAWKSGFREGAKLSSNCIHNADKRSKDRLLIWMSLGLDVENGSWAILGARMGALFGLRYRNSDDLKKINDWAYIKEVFSGIKDIDPLEKVEKMTDELNRFGLNPFLWSKKESQLIKSLGGAANA